MTSSLSTLQNNPILPFNSSGICFSDRQTMISGCIPIPLSSLTECCVGFVFNSPAFPRKGSKVTWIKHTFSLPTSYLICLIDSKKVEILYLL